ncbi:hypothetical protein H5410_022232 [Solanum commersonii]|uniref:Uncharacterized protein n=1 Tax=Solanum commersonii TaxID=4109 RepID=A0A9J5ZG71_SOLCO|nr:hypothetical protein H5410_022232 [Solanum commersonii]
MHVAKMRMLSWMCGHTRCDKIRSEDIQSKVGVASMVNKMREVRLKWFGYVTFILFRLLQYFVVVVAPC